MRYDSYVYIRLVVIRTSRYVYRDAYIEMYISCAAIALQSVAKRYNNTIKVLRQQLDSIASNKKLSPNSSNILNYLLAIK